MAEPAPPPTSPAPSERLMTALVRVLGSTMGDRFIFPSRRGLRPLGAALIWLVGYAVVGLLFVRYVNPSVPGDRRLISLLVWGGGYCATAVYLAQSTTLRIYETVRRDIIPHASSHYLEIVADELERRYPRFLRHGLPLVVAAAALAAAWWALSREMPFPDHPDPRLFSGALLFWLLTYFLHFYAAGVAIIAARFYASFAAHLETEADSFYVLGASDTPLVKGLERLSTEILKFWAMIFFIVLSSMLLVLLPPPDYRLAPESTYLFALIPLAGFFSLGIGTLIHLSTEAHIRAVLHRFTRAQAAALQQQCNRLLAAGADRVPANSREIERLTAWHDRILAGGRYGSRAGASVSIALPLILPVVGLLVEILG